MSVAEDTTQIPTPIPEVVTDNAAAAIVNAVVTDLQSTISNTLEAPLNLVSETPKMVETATKTLINNSEAVVENTTNTILKESQAVIDETTKLIDNITSIMAGKTEPIADDKTNVIISEGQAIVGEATKLVDSAVESVENISKIISDEEKRLTETISRLSIDMEQNAKKATGLFAKIQSFIKLITSCTHGADKSVIIPAVVKTHQVDVNVANVV
jgi:hypothetical protein